MTITKDIHIHWSNLWGMIVPATDSKEDHRLFSCLIKT